MKKRKNLNLDLQLQLFAENSSGTANSESGETQVADAGQGGTEAVVNSENEFQSLIDGKFREQFQKKTQSIIDKRFKETKQLEEYKNKVSPFMQRLSEKYGVENDDFDELNSRVFSEEDKSSDEEKTNHYENLKKQVVSWVKESEQVKNLYPDFDFRNELKSNTLFGRLLYGGVPLQTAYEVVHKDEIIGGAMAYTAQKVKEQVVRGIEAKGRRPLENGIASESGIVTLTDVNALTSKDILKILKQVENGVSVKF